MSNKKTHINWKNTLFLTITPAVAAIGGIWLFAINAITWPTVCLALFLLVATGLSITCGYHRLYSHKSYETVWPVKLFFTLFGSAAFEGSVLEWSTDHRDHHRYTDTDKDPYDIKKGFWFAHIIWLFTLDSSKRDYNNVNDLRKQPLLKWQHKYYILTAIAMGFVFPTVVAGVFWGDWIGGLIIAGALRITLTQHGTFCINSVCHYFGQKPYSAEESARDHWFTALFTFGEGYHNFHHKFPLDFRNGIRFYDFDPSKWLIGTLAFFGLATNLKTITDKRILECRLQAEETRVLSHIETCDTLKAQLHHLIEPAKEAVLSALKKIEALEKQYTDFKMEKRLHEYKMQLKQVRADLKESMMSWSQLMKQADV